MKNDKRELFETMPIGKALLTMAIPTIISQLITMVYNLADTLFIGMSNDPYKVAAASVVSVLFFMLTALSNLFGVEYDSRLMCGRDVLSDQMAIAFWMDGSWKTTLGSYNGNNGKFTPAEGVEVDENYIKSMTAYAQNKKTYSKAVTYYNYFNYINAELERMNAPEIAETTPEGT